MARTTASQVREIVDVHGADDTAKDANIQPFIDIATAYLDRVVQECGDIAGLGSTLLELIERNLAAHFYALSPQGKSARPIKSDAVGEGVSRTWATHTPGKGLRASGFGETALLLDTTGCLERSQMKKARATWLGTPHSTNTHRAGDP